MLTDQHIKAIEIMGECGHSVHEIVDSFDSLYIPMFLADVRSVLNVPRPREWITLTLDGVTRPLTEWAKITGFNYITLSKRKSRGWSDERTLSTPCQKHRRKSQ